MAELRLQAYRTPSPTRPPRPRQPTDPPTSTPRQPISTTSPALAGVHLDEARGEKMTLGQLAGTRPIRVVCEGQHEVIRSLLSLLVQPIEPQMPLENAPVQPLPLLHQHQTIHDLADRLVLEHELLLPLRNLFSDRLQVALHPVRVHGQVDLCGWALIDPDQHLAVERPTDGRGDFDECLHDSRGGVCVCVYVRNSHNGFGGGGERLQLCW